MSLISSFKTALIFALLFQIVILSVITQAQQPAIVWSDREQYVNQIHNLADVKNSIHDASSLVVFLHRDLTTKEFLKYSDAFSKGKQNKLVHLKSTLSSNYHTMFAHVDPSHIQSIQSIDFDYIVSSKSEHGNSNLSLEKFVEDPEKYVENQKVLILFDESVATEHSVKEFDDIVGKVSKTLTNNYIALFSSKHSPAKAEDVSDRILYSNEEIQLYTLQARQNNQTNHTTQADLYTNETIIGGTFLGFFLIFVLVVYLALMFNMKTAPHIADFDENFMKKTQ